MLDKKNSTVSERGPCPSRSVDGSPMIPGLSYTYEKSILAATYASTSIVVNYRGGMDTVEQTYASFLSISIPLRTVSSLAAKEMRTFDFLLEKTLPGMINRLFASALSTKASPSPPGTSGKM